MYLIPKPQKIVNYEGCFIIRYDSYVVTDTACSQLLNQQVLLFMKELKKYLGFELQLSKGAPKAGDIVLKVNDSFAPEHYQLDGCGQVLEIIGSQTGLWCGLQTLLQMVKQEGACLPQVKIEDYPALKHRGHYLDVSRGRIPKMEWLKKWIDKLAFYKINQFQLYIEHTYLFRDLTELWRDDTPFTAAEIMELDEYCYLRGIELVPSLSSFGHLYKLLSTKEYHHLCELENMQDQPFSVLGRMRHHTFDVTNPESLNLIKSMLKEYMELFHSRQFNICADETFDLGTGRSKAKADEIGKDHLYINFVKELTGFMIENGRRPMFWGDVIVGFPDLLKELPPETICLTWGYHPEQREYEVMKMAEAGAIQYCCPGCCGWNELVNLNYNAYRNIKKMAEYAEKHGAIGLLNTDWGDFLHVNHMDFSIPGMIYGAAFAWNSQTGEYEEINRQISKLEYGDTSEKLLSIIDQLKDNTAFAWQSFCFVAETEMGILSQLGAFAEAQDYIEKALALLDQVDQKCENLVQIQTELYQSLKSIPQAGRAAVYPYLIAVEGIRIINLIGKFITAQKGLKTYQTMVDPKQLAKELDIWFYHYKQIYRQISRESELYRIQSFINFYGDMLRS
ncbi:glycoside hydrolase [Clostridiales bacterium COT073_COT-073]|nr:glycoside hydrolase [Clostridiales bacterium COT073_COT-073]